MLSEEALSAWECEADRYSGTRDSLCSARARIRVLPRGMISAKNKSSTTAGRRILIKDEDHSVVSAVEPITETVWDVLPAVVSLLSDQCSLCAS